MTAPDGRDSRVAPPRQRGGLPRGRPDVPRRALVLLFCVWLLGLAAATAPHLVHHAFDADGGADCAFLDVAHHASAVSATPVLVLELLPASERPVVPPPAVRPRIAPASPLGRGPPDPALAPA
jgi:hypothetical protein